jgi:beta-phosphoglucomutase-like phosphatase (HAD superfamily)
VASSGSYAKMRFTLRHTGLYERFDGRIFSAHDVERSKPAPDLFLHAAQRMGAEPRRCAVVEDSVAGVEAAISAGMDVYAFAGRVTPAAKLVRDGAVVFREMAALPDLLVRPS